MDGENVKAIQAAQPVMGLKVRSRNGIVVPETANRSRNALVLPRASGVGAALKTGRQ
jgi:hypothetical protein